VPTPVVSSPNVAANENEDSIPHAQPEPVAADEGEQQQPPGPEIPVAMAPHKGHKELEDLLFLTIMKSIIAKKYKLRVIPPHLKKP